MKRIASLYVARTKRPSSMSMPMVCAYSSTLSLGLRPLITSNKRNTTCPPSRAGMGRMFITANMSESIAVICQNWCQSHTAGNMLPIVPNMPTDLAPSLEKRYLKSLTYPLRTFHPYLIPAGNDAKKPYVSFSTG